MRVHGPKELTVNKAVAETLAGKAEPQRVTVAIYAHEHGDDIRVFASEVAAEEWRQEIAVDYWFDLFSEPMSANLEEAADLYFQRCAEAGLEFFSTQSAEVET